MLQQLGIERGDALVQIRMPAGEFQDEGGQVATALPQRRQAQLDDVQAVEEIGAERVGRHHGLERTVGRRDDADIDGRFAVRPQRPDHAALQRVQQLRLQAERQIVDVVEEDRAAVGCLEESRARGVGTRERALSVTEQFALGQVLGNRAAMHGDEGVMPTLLIERMNRAREDLLAGSGLALQRERSCH